MTVCSLGLYFLNIKFYLFWHIDLSAAGSSCSVRRLSRARQLSGTMSAKGTRTFPSPYKTSNRSQPSTSFYLAVRWCLSFEQVSQSFWLTGILFSVVTCRVSEGRSFSLDKCTQLDIPCSLTAISSVQFSRSVVSDSLWPYESQHTRPPCPSPTPGVYSNTCPSSWWCPPAISSSVVPFSSCPQSLLASGSFPLSQ